MNGSNPLRGLKPVYVLYIPDQNSQRMWVESHWGRRQSITKASVVTGTEPITPHKKKTHCTDKETEVQRSGEVVLLLKDGSLDLLPHPHSLQNHYS